MQQGYFDNLDIQDQIKRFEKTQISDCEGYVNALWRLYNRFVEVK